MHCNSCGIQNPACGADIEFRIAVAHSLNTTIGTCDVLSGPSYRISLLPLQHLTTLRRVTRFVKSLAECAADRHTHACERSAVCRSQSGRGN